MTDFVRVQLDNGNKASVSKAFVDGLEEDVDVLDEPATNAAGRPLPATRGNGRPIKPRTSVKKAAAKRGASTQTTAAAAGDNTDGGVVAEDA